MQYDTVFPIIGLLLLNIAVVSGQTGDPCTDSTTVTLPGLKSRYLNNVVQPFAIDVDDNTLVPGWYKTEGISMLIQSPTDIYQCGTKYPIWLQGQLPQAVNEVVDVTGCTWSLSHDCYPQVAISIKKCPNNEFVYLLPATQTSESGYCFGVDEPPEPPVIRVVTFELTSKTMAGNGRDYTQVDFICNFEQSSSGQNQYYRVRWYENGVAKYMSPYADSSQLANLRLSESLFVANGFQLGNHISCDVELSYQPSGTAIATSARSAQLFVGMEILTPSLIFQCHAEDTVARTVLVRHTLPIGCSGVSSCEIDLKVLVEGAACQRLGVPGDSCGVKIQSTTVIGTDIEVVLTCASTGIYLQSVVDYDVYLRTETLENEIWRNHIVGPIHVQIQPPDAALSLSYGKKCFSKQDPRIFTFDKRYFGLQANYQQRVYVLYRHKEHNAEVQSKVALCRDGGPAYCNCGAAVRMGRDVYVIDACSGQPWINQYKTCDDKVLRVQSFGELHYKIFLPYGTIVETTINQCCGGVFLNIIVQASPDDWNSKSRGLCGTVNDNKADDFVKDDGSTLFSDQDQFIEYWSVTIPEHNMFDNAFDVNAFAPMQFKVCLCAHLLNDPLKAVTCGQNPPAICATGRDVARHRCPEVMRRRRSVTEDTGVPSVDVSKSLAWTRKKRDNPTELTFAQATDICNSKFGNNTLYGLCAEVPNAQSDTSLHSCALDIELLNDPDWGDAAIREMVSTCKSELPRNPALWVSDNDEPSLAQAIQEIGCTNDCSGQGTCDNGTCLCESGYDGADCSFLSHDVIEVAGLLDGGRCNEHEITCKEIVWIFGFPILNSANFVCRLEEFTISNNGTRQSLAPTLVTGIFSTIVEAGCPLHSSAPPGYFAHGFSVSISNDQGEHLSQELEHIIYDPVCQDAVLNSSGMFDVQIKDNCCFIEGRCYSNWDEDGRDNNCFTCLSFLSTWTWTWNFHPGCLGSTAIIHGDPHITTFDGKKYTCSNVGWFYLMYDDPTEAYAIVGEFIKYMHRSRLKSILIKYFGHEYHLGQNLQLKVDGSNGMMPYWRLGEIFIYETAHNTIRAILSNWITIEWDGQNTAHISVPKVFFWENTHALCGTYNGNIADDITKHNGDVTNNKNQFVMSWTYP